MEYFNVVIALLLVIGFFSLFIVVFLHLKNYKKFSRYLEKQNPEKWRELGEPSFSNSSLRNIIRLLKFLNACKEQEDPKLLKLANDTKKTLRISIVIFGIESILILMLSIFN